MNTRPTRGPIALGLALAALLGGCASMPQKLSAVLAPEAVITKPNGPVGHTLDEVMALNGPPAKQWDMPDGRTALRRSRLCGVDGTGIRVVTTEADRDPIRKMIEPRTPILVTARPADGERLFWARGTGADPVPESDADAYIARQLRYDPDVWVVEVEDRQGRHWFEGPVR